MYVRIKKEIGFWLSAFVLLGVLAFLLCLLFTGFTEVFAILDSYHNSDVYGVMYDLFSSSFVCGVLASSFIFSFIMIFNLHKKSNILSYTDPEA